MDNKDQKNTLKAKKQTRSPSANIPLYQRYKGKEMYGEKTYKTTDKEKRTVKILLIVFAAIMLLAFIFLLLPINFLVKILLFFLSILIGMGTLGGYMFYAIYRHHKEDPIEFEYYDIDFKHNNITGKGYNNSKKITKEEFYNKPKKDEDKKDS